MSVKELNTHVSKIRSKLVSIIKDKNIAQAWFVRIICLKFLQVKSIIKEIKYDKESIIELLYKENELLPNVFFDDIENLKNNYPANLFSYDIVNILNTLIDENTNVEKINDYLEDYKDHERLETFTFTKRKSNALVDESNITAATQIFTPKWITKYLSDNLLNNVNGKYNILKDNMPLDFKNIKIIDPCLGAGNMLITIFDDLISFYDNITIKDITHIFKKQLFGLDIDDYAITLSKFIFAIKAYELDNRFLEKENYCLPNFYKIDNSVFESGSLIGSLLKQSELNNKIIQSILNDKYDIVITNPPYMGKKSLPDELLEYISLNYKLGKSELYTAFIQRCLEMLKPNGKLGMITLHTWMFIKSFSDLRMHVLNNYQIESLLHLGPNTFENLNSYNALACSFVITNKKDNNDIVFVKLDQYQNIVKKEEGFFDKNNYYYVSSKKLLSIPLAPFVYYFDNASFDIINKAKKLSSIANIRQGLATGNNKEFVRYYFEVDKDDICFNANSYEEFKKSNKLYAPYNKGGDQTKWYTCSKTVIKFDEKAYLKLSNQGNHLPSKEFYFKEGITWSLFGFNTFNVRYKEEGYVFDVSGSTLFSNKKYEKYILAYLSSNVAFYFLSSFAPTVNFQVGNIASLPIIIDENSIPLIDKIVDEQIKYAKTIDKMDELSWNYEKDILINNYDNNLTFSKNLTQVKSYIDSINEKIAQNEKTINILFNKIYNLNLDSSIKTKPLTIDKNDIIKNFLSYIIGVVFGRYKIDKYISNINNEKIIEITDVVNEVIICINKLLNENAHIEIQNYMKISLYDYYKKYFFKDHLKKYHNTPIYWYIKKNNNIYISYYHKVKEKLTINKDLTIVENYKNNELLYKLN